ncbi:hypothetical protein HPCPY1313_1613 [Helicobacter pylori CPY1313]|nr:hypothetical protein HPCPY1313_1613 [Helicobacter pylori CPY1313]
MDYNIKKCFFFFLKYSHALRRMVYRHAFFYSLFLKLL